MNECHHRPPMMSECERRVKKRRWLSGIWPGESPARRRTSSPSKAPRTSSRRREYRIGVPLVIAGGRSSGDMCAILPGVLAPLGIGGRSYIGIFTECQEARVATTPYRSDEPTTGMRMQRSKPDSTDRSVTSTPPRHEPGRCLGNDLRTPQGDGLATDVNRCAVVKASSGLVVPGVL
jgi:hypothetical protein